MTDPLTVLRGGDLPVRPDPAFAAALRTRLESALRMPTGTGEIEMSGTDTAIAEMTTATEEAAAPPRPAALPYLTVADARAAIDWYVDALGATPVGAPVVMDDGRIGHAELAVAGGVFYLADEYPEIGLAAPAPQRVSVSLMLPVPDTDAALRRARDRGAQVQHEPYENYGSRSAAIVDPFGHRWMLTGPVTGAATPIQHGDVGYVSLWTPDADRAAAFYGHVLGWVYDPDSHRVTNVGQRIGIYSVGGRSTLFCCYAVTDLAGARQSIEAAGGRVGTETEFDFGTVLDAVDPLGTDFAVYTPAPGTPRPELNGGGPGELSYITHEVTDSARFREFYSRLLFWMFEGGRVEDGWQVDGAHPMTGMAGGSDAPATVPMWTVTDIDEAVRRVTEAGGSVLQAPARQPYGLMAECTDDQGGRFYLGQF
ncbi:VOC family protein [Mycolicibacterium sp. S2-37]|uniref:VOC family protein n=1 Tax=Mycolicibacterium sp. S2-37 TaxID=2810297 RepID=UPI001A946B34|nr:VOC family protein [Mycolicibacterium sp. S2-37]MBO0678947.1 VOC family protein [Mycolicibacterium sp. S2-37]